MIKIRILFTVITDKSYVMLQTRQDECRKRRYSVGARCTRWDDCVPSSVVVRWCDVRCSMWLRVTGGGCVTGHGVGGVLGGHGSGGGSMVDGWSHRNHYVPPAAHRALQDVTCGDNRRFTERRKKTVRFDQQDMSGVWTWDDERQGSQDSQTKDSGIDTSSTFTSSEDSNRGDVPKVGSHPRTHQVRSLAILLILPNLLLTPNT